MDLEIIGPGYIHCEKLAENTGAAAKELAIQYELMSLLALPMA